MSATGFMRGHLVRWDGKTWRYEDGQLADGLRPCVKCGEPPTPDGYDACIGYVPGMSSVCCGHDLEQPYQVEDTHGRANYYECSVPGCELDGHKP